MRLRNVPGSREFIEKSPYTVKEPDQMISKWRSDLFKRDESSKLYIEIGMGKGRFLMTHAANNPDICYVGIEKFSSVLVRALEKRPSLETDNLYFIRFDAEYITSIFGEGEVDRIYLNFSDPWPKDRHAKRRLTSKQFLDRYRHILADDGIVVFKTDNRDLFDFSLEQVNISGWELVDHTNDLHNSKLAEGNVMTEYEEKFSAEGTPICEMIIKNPRQKFRFS